MNPKDLVGAKKAPVDLVPPSAVIAMAAAMGNGADKYGPFNWRDQPVQVRTYLAAALRHIYAYLDGQEAAEDTGISHLAHAMASLAIVYDANALGSVDDNRSSGPAADLLRAQDKSVNPGNIAVMPSSAQPLGEGNWQLVGPDAPNHIAGSKGVNCNWSLTGKHSPTCYLFGERYRCGPCGAEGRSQHPLTCPNWGNGPDL